MALKQEMDKKFNSEESRVLKILNYSYYDAQKQWSLNRGEIFTAETQLGYTKAKTKEMIIKALNIFERYPKQEVLKWLGLD